LPHVYLDEVIMSNTIVFTADQLPQVTVDEVSRFAAAVDIRDAHAFAAELQAFVRERLNAVQQAGQPAPPGPAGDVEQALARKAAALRAPTRWTPRATDIQRGRRMLLDAFNQPHNLLLSDFAGLAGKSRQQIYKDIEARRLLALNVGPRGCRLPDWQLDPVKQQLTQAVLGGSTGVDNWTLYRALSEPLEALGGLSPVQTVTPASVDAVARAVFTVLGIH
jgi:hypothetical protein